jgi:hypothetical protein
MAGGAEHRDATEFLEVRAVPFEQAYRWVLANKIVDAKSMIGILWAKQRLDLEESRDRGRTARNRPDRTGRPSSLA